MILLNIFLFDDINLINLFTIKMLFTGKKYFLINYGIIISVTLFSNFILYGYVLNIK